MKAIVANVFFGGIFGCLSYANSTLATPVKSESIYSKQIMPAQLSTRFTRSNVPVIPQLFGVIDSVLPTAGLRSWNNAADSSSNKGYHQWLEHTMSSSFSLPLQTNYFFPQISPETNCGLAFCDDRSEQSSRLLSSPQQADLHKSSQGGLVLGLQKTFWASENQHQYWGITTVQHWGQNKQQSNPSSLNYTDVSPILALGSSTLTFSGGVNDNLGKSAILKQGFNSAQEFEDFRGGIAYHHGITQQLTMGVGFVYENTLAGFTQLTYDSDILPIKATISLLAKESGIDFYSHIRFQPTPNFVANYYRDGEKQKFDLNWSVYNGLTLMATGNSKTKSYSTGVKIALDNNYFSLRATAALDNEQKLRLQLNSQIGRLKFTYSSNQDQSNLELRGQLLDLDNLGIQCSAFVKYQTLGKKQQEFMVWGANIHSQAQVSQNRHQWEFEVGYGTSSDDQGWMANGTIALQPNLFLKLGYQEVSAISDETKIKLQLSSN
ncbi:hypothetical protein C7B62_24140 [Pleurocapsa sp. CCALA 161]|uniref:hypothetical protein n=1 Tax=Pleurocapsa sp. CCALA 161 TaxID=2107688 RepID=UPI000D055745|nr:hypothetical protein [Pleurocapsa sp. CCALA 161]PSB05917.1 hypothetical protein C7B62_24140 [Pleurocapsa sp. CCALA 161]